MTDETVLFRPAEPPPELPHMVWENRKLFLAHLREHPGEWFEYQPDLGGVARSQLYWFRNQPGIEARYETVSQRNPPRCRVFVRFVP